jgi:hypothetical protein
MKFKPYIAVHTKPDLPEEKKEEIKRALLKALSGGLQAAQGPAKAAFVDDFLSLFPPERVLTLEKGIKRLFDIEKFPKFRAEVICMMFDLFLGGLASELDSEFEDFLKRHGVRFEE